MQKTILITPTNLGYDSSVGVAALPIYPLEDGAYSRASGSFQVPEGYVTIVSVALLVRRTLTGNVRLRFSSSYVDLSTTSTPVTDSDSYTEYNIATADNKVYAITVPPAVYSAITSLSSNNTLGFAVERDATEDTGSADTFAGKLEVVAFKVVIGTTDGVVATQVRAQFVQEILALAHRASSDADFGDSRAEACWRAAMRQYNKDMPKECVYRIAHVDNQTEYELPSDFDVIHGIPRSVECPIGSNPPDEIDPYTICIYKGTTVLNVPYYKLRFLELLPSADFNFYYTTPYNIPNDDVTLVDTPTSDFDGICKLAVGFGFAELAARYAQSGTSSQIANTINYLSKRQEYSALAKQFIEYYEAHIGKAIDEAPAASVSVSWRRDVPSDLTIALNRKPGIVRFLTGWGTGHG